MIQSEFISVMEQAVKKTLSHAYKKGWNDYHELTAMGFNNDHGFLGYQMSESELTDELEKNIKQVKRKTK